MSVYRTNGPLVYSSDYENIPSDEEKVKNEVRNDRETEGEIWQKDKLLRFSCYNILLLLHHVIDYFQPFTAVTSSDQEHIQIFWDVK